MNLFRPGKRKKGKQNLYREFSHKLTARAAKRDSCGLRTKASSHYFKDERSICRRISDTARSSPPSKSIVSAETWCLNHVI